MNNNYNELAANWWAEQMQQAQVQPIQNLDAFKDELSKNIKNYTSINGSMIISTYNSKSQLLNDVAFYSGITADIPSGYEMKILLDQVFIYNKIGKLVANF